ncbi:MAG: hypothetical protein L3K19_06770 [Thermoplasmata archaeon]|nr:hypothetical protein [Thermoplasmata archaeon]
MPVPRSLRSRPAAALAGVLLLALLLAIPLPAGPSGSAPPRHTAPRPSATSLPDGGAMHTLRVTGVVTPNAVPSLDWDGMGVFQVTGVNPNLVAGEGAAMVSDSLYKTIVLFGGRGAAGLNNLTLQVSQVTGRWKNITTPIAPSPRANMSFADDASGRLAVLFGGTTDPLSGRSDNSTWVFWYGNRSWENVTHRIAPPARESAAFAIDPQARVGLLEGGWDPDFVSGGSTGSVTWNDTWLLNLTTFDWTEVLTQRAPTPMFGSAMAFDPIQGEFLMFGGCNAACTNAVVALNLTRGVWETLTPPIGSQVPAPGGGSDFLWSPYANATVMFGGFGPTTSAFASYNSTFVFEPLTHLWTYIQGFSDPFPRYAAAATWLSANGCPGLFLAGGSSAFYGPPPDLWFLDPNPDTGVGCNVWGNDQVGNFSGNGTGCNGNGTLVVVVSDNTSHTPIANASVSLTGACGPKSGVTDRAGMDVLTHVPLTVEAVKVTAVDYHSGGSVVNVTANYTVNRTGPVPPPLRVNLTPLPSLRLRTFGESLANPHSPLGAVAITMDDSVILGNTSALGYLNQSAVSTTAGRLTFGVFKAGYSSPEFVTTLPYTGIIWVNLTLQAAGILRVEVRLAGGLRAVPTATGRIVPVDPGSPGGPVGFVVNQTGQFSVFLSIGNYTVSAQAPGYTSNRTIAPVFHPWVSTTVVVLNLTPDQGYNVTVQVLDILTHRPIDNATVEVGDSYTRSTDAQGWANFSNVRPPGGFGVLASAAGYAANESFVALDPTHPRVSLTIDLTPLACVPPGCTQPATKIVKPFGLLPTTSESLVFLLAAPGMLLGASVVYAWYLRRRTAVATP